MSPVYSVKRSEDEIGEKYDRCLTNTITKTATGLGVGVLASLIMFQRKTWPIAFGSGIGLGMAFANCQTEFRNIYPKQKPLSVVNDALSPDTSTTVTITVPSDTPAVNEETVNTE